MKLTVIIPIFNVEKYLERCVMSVISQDFPQDDFEIILINDGSTDRSYEIAKGFRDKYPNIILLSQENKGQGAARNKGLLFAKGDYILFVDSDDYLLPTIFGKMIEEAESKDLDILIMQSMSMKEDGTFHNVHTPPIEENIVVTGEDILLMGYRPASVWAKLFKKDLIIESVGGFEEGIIHEDVDFDLKLFSYAKRISFLKLCCYVYFWNALSTDKLMYYDKIIKSLNSDIIIASDLKAFSSQSHLSLSLSNLFVNHSNSLIVSLCYSLISRYKHLSYSDKVALINRMVNCHLLPFRGKSNSKKSNFIGFFLKWPRLLKLIAYITSYINSLNYNVNR